MKYWFRVAEGDDWEWSARLMAGMDPWLRLGRSYEDRLEKCGHPEYTLLIEVGEKGRAGCALLHPRGVAGSPYVASIAVAPEARGEGAGTALLDYAENYFEGARHMFLCVSSFNPRARALYERLGYELVGELKDYAMEGSSEFLMVKRLGGR